MSYDIELVSQYVSCSFLCPGVLPAVDEQRAQVTYDDAQKSSRPQSFVEAHTAALV